MGRTQPPKINKMVEICMQNKAFRENYQNKKDDPQKVNITFLRQKQEFEQVVGP